MYDLPYLFFVLLRSSKSLSLTVSSFVIGKCLPNKRQTIDSKDVLFSLVTTVGLLVFNMEGSKDGHNPILFIPIFMSVVGMLFESLSGYYQEDIRRTLKPTAFEFMLAQSFYGGLIAIFNWIMSEEFSYTFKLFAHSSEALKDQFAGTIIMCIGYVFMFRILSRHGPIVIALISCTRKVFTVLLSAWINGTVLGGPRAFGILTVCIGVVIECSRSICEKKPLTHQKPSLGVNAKTVPVPEIMDCAPLSVESTHESTPALSANQFSSNRDRFKSE